MISFSFPLYVWTDSYFFFIFFCVCVVVVVVVETAFIDLLVLFVFEELIKINN